MLVECCIHKQGKIHTFFEAQARLTEAQRESSKRRFDKKEIWCILTAHTSEKSSFYSAKPGYRKIFECDNALYNKIESYLLSRINRLLSAIFFYFLFFCSAAIIFWLLYDWILFKKKCLCFLWDMGAHHQWRAVDPFSCDFPHPRFFYQQRLSRIWSRNHKKCVYVWHLSTVHPHLDFIRSSLTTILWSYRYINIESATMLTTSSG